MRMFSFSRRVLLALTLTAVAPQAAAASSAKQAAKAAATACSNAADVSQPFAAFGDTADYSLAPGGDFEGSATGWTFTNAKLVNENESIGIVKGSQSLLLGADPSGGEAIATSPEFCVSDLNPTFRFVMRSNRGTAHTTNLTTIYSYRRLDQSDKIRTTSTSEVLLYSPVWAPSAISPLATLLTSGKAERGKLLRLSFHIPAAAVKAGGMMIDNVEVDPLRRS
jgi:hypothetical protein